ncbi:hypothetical protein ACEQ8H_001601 [Pleosporales sp. CAS-2024a]
MSLFRTLDRASAVSHASNARPLMALLHPPLPDNTCRRALFIQALVQAGTCHAHPPRGPSVARVPPCARQSTWTKPAAEATTPNAASGGRASFKKMQQFAKSELEALVDYYGIELDTRPEEDVPDHEGSLIWNVGDDHEPWPVRNAQDAAHIRRLQKLLEDDEASHADVFETYKNIAPPGVVYLELDTIRALLHHLSIVERPSPLAMQRFLSILDDMKNAHIHILRSEWTSAIYLTGNAMGAVSADDLQSALQLWRDMERRAGVKGGAVTLNVLFDMSVRAGKFQLAETFLDELHRRKLPLHRHFRVSKIYYHGLMQNGSAVRDTYQDLVRAGDIVDTVVLNAVIAALIRAGEPSAAEHVFERMKRLHASKHLPAPGHRFFNRTWRDKRALGLYFTHEARRLRRADLQEPLKELQDYAPVAPDPRTYALLIRHQAVTVGDIDRVYDLLREMQYNAVPLDGSIFIFIFHGFADFGGIRYSSWTRDKLERIWKQYLKALQDSLERTWISVKAVISALKAFAKCTDAERTLKAWEEIRSMWQPSAEELEKVLRALRKLAPQGDGFFHAGKPAV